MKFTHRKLCEDLAQIKGTKFFEVPLGSVWSPALGLGDKTQIADVITIRPSYTKFNLDIYECKVSRSDFLSDIRSGKWEGYLPHCHRFYFALLSGIAKKDEIPKGAGLIVRGEKGWVTIKAAKPTNNEIPKETMMSMIFKKASQDNFERRYYVSEYATTNFPQHNQGLKKILSKKVRTALRFYDKHRFEIEGK